MRESRKYRGYGAVLLMMLMGFLTGCNDQNELGIEVLPREDLINVHNTILKDQISGYTFTETGISTGNSTKSLLGNFNDPVFGNTNINFATQVRLRSFPKFGTNPQADSVKLFLYYRIMYGDTVTPQKFRVHELKSDLDIDTKYQQDIDLRSMAYDKVLSEMEYTPKVRRDSTSGDTLLQVITIPLDKSLGEKLVNADSTQMVNNEVFLQFFKGLYIESENFSNQGGSILSLEAASTGGFQGSAIAVYYVNDEVKAETENDTTLIMPYVITGFSSRVNSITHDYSNTNFYKNLDSESEQDSLIYVQATGGLKSRILIDGLSSWRDSVNTAINKAELVFTVDTVATEYTKYPLPQQLLFTFVDSTGTERLPLDYFFSPTFYGGQLQEDYTYRFNVTQHLQQIIEGGVQNNGFFLTSARKNDQANRVVLKGGSSNQGIQLIVTYSKFYN